MLAVKALNCNVPVAQLDRAQASDAWCRWFKSIRVRQKKTARKTAVFQCLCDVFPIKTPPLCDVFRIFFTLFATFFQEDIIVSTYRRYFYSESRGALFPVAAQPNGRQKAALLRGLNCSITPYILPFTRRERRIESYTIPHMRRPLPAVLRACPAPPRPRP